MTCTWRTNRLVTFRADGLIDGQPVRQNLDQEPKEGPGSGEPVESDHAPPLIQSNPVLVTPHVTLVRIIFLVLKHGHLYRHQVQRPRPRSACDGERSGGVAVDVTRGTR